MTPKHGTRQPPEKGDRGQTLIDYVIGVSVFFVTLGLVMTLLPSFVSPFQSDVAGEDTAQAERITKQIVSNLSVQGYPNSLNLTSFQQVLGLPEADLNDRYGVADFKNINITVRTMNGSSWITAGGSPLTSQEPYHGEGAASEVRIVAFEDGTDNCTPACRIRVRVW